MSTEKKAKLLACIAKGLCEQEVVDVLFEGGIPNFECEFWDYKLLLGNSPASLGELVRDVVAFYNSYGGYLVIGVKDGGIAVPGASSVPFDEKQIKQKVRNYTGHDVVVRIFSAVHDGKQLVCIAIPKRPPDQPVAVMRQDGPVGADGKPVFRAGTVYFRADESCQLIRGGEDLQFLSSPRQHPLEPRLVERSLVSHNLPDRSMICETFVGRVEAKQQLWLWLSDRMSRYRIVAGPGGVGKTSSAYSFAEEVIQAAPLGFMQVVWLSAKERQFDASKNAYVTLTYASADTFNDISSLLVAIAHHLPVAQDEIEDLPEEEIIRNLQGCLSLIPTLFVVDDLDSLSNDDQRRAIEIAMLLGGERVKFLLTTRKNYFAPPGSVELLPGLQDQEFEQFVKILEARFERSLSEKEVKTLQRETKGSPLFAESVFRLLRVGDKFSDAMERWRGVDGEAVRAAAFRKELEQLSLRSRRVLFVISQFESLSSIEIRKIAELEQAQLDEALVELDQLFLVSSEQIGSEARFSAAPGIAAVLMEKRADLIPNHVELLKRSAAHRTAPRLDTSARGNSRYVGKVIAQAMTQLAVDRKGALATVLDALKTEKTNADLWMVYARCLSAQLQVDNESVRKAFSKSYELGKREQQLFEKWIQFELLRGNSNAAVDVAEKGSQALISPHWSWYAEVAVAYQRRGSERLSRREFLDAETDLNIANNFLGKALQAAPESARTAIRDSIAYVDERLEVCRGAKKRGQVHFVKGELKPGQGRN